MIAFKLIIDSSLKIIGFDNEAKKFNPSIKLYTELSEYFRKELCEIIFKAISEGKEAHTFQTNYEETIAINQIILNSYRSYIIDLKQVIRSVSTESYLKAIVQSQVHAQLLIDHNNELLWFNKKAAEILYSLIGKTPEKGDLVSSYQISKNQDQFDFHLNMAQSGALASYDERFELPDASELWLKQEFLPVIDTNGIIQGVAYNLHDITLSKKVVNQLLQAEDRYKSLINNLNVGVIIHKKGQIVYCNNAAAKIAGAINVQELIGAQLINYVSAESKKDVLERIKSIQKVGDYLPKITEKLLRLNGLEFYAEVSATGVMFNGDFAVQVMINDISSYKKSENEYLNFNRQLMLINKELEHYTYIVSHNLRTPIANSQALFEYLDLSQLDEQNKEVAEKLGQSIIKANSTLDDLLTIIQRKKQQKSFVENVRFHQLINEFKKSHFKAISDSGTKIIEDFDAIESIIVDRIKIESIFQNLLTNAVKYRSADRSPIIKVSTETSGENVIIKFEDNGMGLDLAVIKDSIFGLFKTFHNNTDAKGLGLFLVKSEIESLQGYITVSSIPNVGTTFSLQLPIKQGELNRQDT